MAGQNPQEPELFQKFKKTKFSIPKIKLPGGGKLKYLIILEVL